MKTSSEEVVLIFAILDVITASRWWMDAIAIRLTSKNDLNFELSLNQLIKKGKNDSSDLNTLSSIKHLSFDMCIQSLNWHRFPILFLFIFRVSLIDGYLRKKSFAFFVKLFLFQVLVFVGITFKIKVLQFPQFLKNHTELFFLLFCLFLLSLFTFSSFSVLYFSFFVDTHMTLLATPLAELVAFTFPRMPDIKICLKEKVKPIL